MKDTSQFFKSAVLIVFLNSLIFHTALIAAGQPDDIENMPLEDIVHIMTRTHPQKDLYPKILNKAEIEPDLRKSLVDALVIRLFEDGTKIGVANTSRSLRDLNAREVLPQLMKIWNKIEKKTYALEHGDQRIQLLLTIAHFLPQAEHIQFLINTESDTAEAPIVRFRATILLCATGNQKAIQHVLSVYENAKVRLPLTTRMSLDDQKRYVEKIEQQDNNLTPWDFDRDLISSYIETGLLLDPANIDTDSDGLIDGNDRNPLCKPQEGELSEDQLIAQFILYLHARYYSISRSPFNFNLLVVQPIDTWDGKGNQSLFDGLEFAGIDGLILHMNQEQIKQFRSLHGSGVSVISIHKEQESEDKKAIKEFRLSVSGGPGLHRTYDMRFKRFNNVWLPVFWQLGMIT